MSTFDDLLRDIDDGILGKNSGLPMGFSRLNRYIGIRKRIYTLVFGATGSGKTSFVHDAYILNPFDWYISSANPGNIKFKVLLFSMERSKIYIMAKWVSRKIFLESGENIPVAKMLGWWTDKMTPVERSLVAKYREYIDLLENEVLDVYEGARSPSDVRRIVKMYTAANGKEEPINEFKQIYIPNHPNEIVIPIVDHLGLARTNKDYSTKKEAIDGISDAFQYFRDFYGMSPIAVSQITRELGSVQYQKMDSFEPTLDHAKESGRPAEDADNVISLFDPLRYHTNDMAYDATKFINNETGAKHFRSVKILKNTYGEDDIRVGMGFWGTSGIFKELPRFKKDEAFDYQHVIDGTFFKL
jgi:hypothetical protein